MPVDFFLFILIIITVLSCQMKNTGSPEVLMFSETIDWGWELGEFYGGNSFYLWQLKPDKPVDFSRPGDIYRIGLVLWKAEPLCLPMAQGLTNSNACENPEQAALDFFPLRAMVSVVAVADG
jgi:hypothetical protein